MILYKTNPEARRNKRAGENKNDRQCKLRMTLLWNLLRDGNDVELPNIWSAVCEGEESEGAKGGDNEGAERCLYGRRTRGCMDICKLLKKLFAVAKRGNHILSKIITSITVCCSLPQAIMPIKAPSEIF